MKKIKDIAVLVFAAAMMGYLIFLLGRTYFTNHIAKNNIRYAKAVIIGHRNYDVNRRVTDYYTYSYSFLVDGQTYTGNSFDKTVKVGDTIEIEYDKKHPSLNKSLHPKD